MGHRKLRTIPRTTVVLTAGLLCLIVFQFCRWHWGKLTPDNLLRAGLDTDNPGEVREALVKGADPNDIPDEDESMRPLECASVSQDVRMTRLLLEHGANPNLDSGWGSPLKEAVQFDKSEELGVDASSRSLQVMEVLIRYGAAINDEEGNSPALWAAAVDGKTKQLRFLLAHGANPRTKFDIFGKATSVYEVAQESHQDAAAILRLYLDRTTH